MNRENHPYRVVVAGAGFAGAVCARVLAENGLRVLLLEKRPHIGGNAYDCPDKQTGLLIHQYGPHIFHTNDKDVFDFLSRFTDWNGYEHRVLAKVHGTLLQVPFNFESLEKAFSADKAAALTQKLIAAYGAGGSVSILELMKTDDPELSALGRYVYKNIFETYTVKQWDLPPESIDPATTARVPVRLSHDCRYFTDRFQGLPCGGYTALFERMLRHENITVRTGVDCKTVVSLADGTLRFNGDPFHGAFVYTGAPDELLDYRYGALPYRTLDFAFETHTLENYQPCGTVNYTVDKPYTRITEFKHMTGERSSSTVILKEFSKSYTPRTQEIPYYPVISPDSKALYARYAAALSDVKGLYLAGRLAEYRYANMDAVASRAMQLGKDILAAL